MDAHKEHEVEVRNGQAQLFRTLLYSASHNLNDLEKAGVVATFGECYNIHVLRDPCRTVSIQYQSCVVLPEA